MSFNFNDQFVAPLSLEEDPKYEPTDLPVFVADDHIIDEDRNELGLDRNDLIKILKNKVVQVTFKKVDGSTRVMTATLKDDIVPPSPESDGTRAVNLSVVPCWDVNERHWKSFRVDSLQAITIL